MSMPEMYLTDEPSPPLAETNSLWWDKALVTNAKNALARSRAVVTTIMSELAFCPYRSGMHGRNAPVLPSPDELKYVEGILQRITLCLEHAIGSDEGVRSVRAGLASPNSSKSSAVAVNSSSQA